MSTTSYIGCKQTFSNSLNPQDAFLPMPGSSAPWESGNYTCTLLMHINVTVEFSSPVVLSQPYHLRRRKVD